MRNRECPALLLADILRYKENSIPELVGVSASDTAGLGKSSPTIARATA